MADIQVGITIPESDWPMFYNKFSAKCPMPMIDHKDETVPKYKTAIEHVNAKIESYLRKIEERGGDILKLKEPSQYDEMII